MRGWTAVNNGTLKNSASVELLMSELAKIQQLTEIELTAYNALTDDEKMAQAWLVIPDSATP